MSVTCRPGGPVRTRAGLGHRAPSCHARVRPAPGRRRRDRGAATAELAAGLPVVVLLLLFGLTAVGAVTTRLQCVDAAREAARVAARGGDGVVAGQAAAPAGAKVSLVAGGDTVVATVRSPVPMLGVRLPGITVTATAVAATEPGTPQATP